MPEASSVDQYVASFTGDAKAALAEIRRVIRSVVPDGQETITYQMPTVKVGGKALVHFAGWKEHVSLYPVPSGDEAFQRAIEPYRSGQGTLKFPLSRPIPLDLIKQVVSRLLEQRRAPGRRG